MYIEREGYVAYLYCSGASDSSLTTISIHLRTALVQLPGSLSKEKLTASGQASKVT